MARQDARAVGRAGLPARSRVCRPPAAPGLDIGLSVACRIAVPVTAPAPSGATWSLEAMAVALAPADACLP